MDDNTEYRLGPNVGLIPCKTKDQKFWNSSIHFMRWLTDNFTDGEVVAIIKILCDFIAKDGTCRSCTKGVQLAYSLSTRRGQVAYRQRTTRMKKFQDFGILQALLPNELPNERTNGENVCVPHPVVGPIVPPRGVGLLNKETKKKDTNSHLLGARWEEIINVYPKRLGGLGRSTALKRLHKVEARWDEFLRAIRNYKTEVEKSGNEGTKYVKQVSTFISCWEDYLTPTVEESYEERTWRENS